MKRTVLAAAVMLGLAPAVLAANPPPAEKFVETAAVAGMFEVESSKIAEEKAKSEDVKSFAAKMVEDHTKANEKLKEAAGSMTVPAKLDSAHQAKIDQLKNAEAGEFDALYVEMQVSAHQQAVDLFGSYSQGGDDPKLKSFATETLPTLKQHYEHIEKIDEAM